MNPKLRILALVLLAGAGALAWWTWARDPRPAGALVLYGNVDVREVELAFRQGGRLASVAVDEGAQVKAGEELAALDPQPYVDALAVADAQLRQVRAELDKLVRGNRVQEIGRAEENVRQAEAVLRRLDDDLRRQSELAAQGMISERALAAARTAQQEAAAALAAARQALALQRAGTRPEDLEAARARVAAAEAARSQAQTAVQDTRLVAPADGVVLARVREPGSMVGNRDPILTLSLRRPVYVRAYVAEPELGRVVPGTPVRVSTDGSPRSYRGQVGFVSPRAEFTPKSVETPELRTSLVYRLRIVVSDDDEALRQGMPVTVTLDPASGAGQPEPVR